MKIDERWLGKIGGWQELKAGRDLWKAGQIDSANFEGQILKATVRIGGKSRVCGLLIHGEIDVENLCSCPTSRRDGRMCRHSLAAALAWIDPNREKKTAPLSGSSESSIPGKTSKPSELDLETGYRIVFHPSHLSALKRGRIVVRVESDASGRDPDNSDQRLAGWLLDHGIDSVPVELNTRDDDAQDLLGTLSGHQHILIGEKAARIESIPYRPMVSILKSGTSYKFHIDKVEKFMLISMGRNYWAHVVDRSLFLPLSAENLPREDLLGLLESTSKAPLDRDADWLRRHLEALENAFRLEPENDTPLPSTRLGIPCVELQLEGSLNHLVGDLAFQYGNESRRIMAGSREQELPEFPVRSESPGVYLHRNPMVEKAAVQRLEKAGFSGPDKSGKFVLRGESAILRWLASFRERWEQDWQIELGERFRYVVRDVSVIRPRISMTAGEGSGELDSGWLDVDIGYSGSSGDQLSAAEVRKLLQSGKSSARRGNRILALDTVACEDLDEILLDVNPEQADGQWRIRPEQFAYLQSIEKDGENPNDQLPEFPEEALPDLTSILRDYQREGVRWFSGRAAMGLSGLLADEMGLGKTLQCLASLQVLKARAEISEPSLIVCPTSLLANWKREAARFTPELDALVLHGPQRNRLWKKIPSVDLVVTSYGLLDRDREKHAAQSYRVAVFDEAGALKNRATRVAAAARELRARFRWALTGTPVENSVSELWSIMEIVHPGYLGPAGEFAARYEKPLRADPPPSAVLDRLRRRIAPFVLRRTKRAVAEDLPPKITQDITVELSGRQQDLYTNLLRESRTLMEDFRREASGAARMHVLTALLRLRQTCCHPALVDGGSEYDTADSAKTSALLELLESALPAGHRVLVFSQFTGMLRLLSLEFDAAKISYAYLDGQTRRRQAAVDRFQAGEVEVFLISLKAGGYGLNLTRADTVVHYDPWWNPAVEAQAEDRAHRIGQDRAVSVYRLIASETVEERITRLQRKKRSIFDAALDDQAPLMRGLDDGDIVGLLG